MTTHPKVSSRERKELEKVLLWHHLDEASKKNAEVWNLGWAEGPTFIHSKTSKGELFSQIDAQTRNVTHEWTK